MTKGWFRIPGVQDGERSLQEQLQGLAPVLGMVRDKTVLDLGCAEGLIAIEMARAGARLVHGVECNPQVLGLARELAHKHAALPVVFWGANLNRPLPGKLAPQYDVVLLLAILHKLTGPAAALRRFAALARERIAIRLPLGSSRAFRSKQGGELCDVNAILPDLGFVLEQTLPGPRRELVQHWLRTG
jgi:SAM-dependent methyltransferase